MKPIIQALIIILATTTPAIAEVMDKEPSLSTIWVIAVVCAVFGFGAARFKPLLTIGTGLVAGLYLGGMVLEINEQAMGKVIIAEAGYSYPTQVYAALGFVIISHAVGFALRKGRQQRS